MINRWEVRSVPIRRQSRRKIPIIKQNLLPSPLRIRPRMNVKSLPVQLNQIPGFAGLPRSLVQPARVNLFQKLPGYDLKRVNIINSGLVPKISLLEQKVVAG